MADEENRTSEILRTTVARARYTDLELIGKGGMGEVYKARDTQLRRVVALKVVQPSADVARQANLLKRFEREVLSLAKLNHTNVVRIYDFDANEGQPYYTMEYVSGKSLSDLLEERAKITLRDAAKIVCQLADAVAAAHAEGIVHRDIKPANILIAVDGKVKLMDFGLAKFMGPDAVTALTKTGQMVGTIMYMPPEVFKAKESASPGDVYQLGIILYELVTGEHPLATSSMNAIASGDAFRKMPLPSSFVASLPKGLEDIVVRATHVDPEARPTAAQLRDDLKTWLKEAKGNTETMPRPAGSPAAGQQDSSATVPPPPETAPPATEPARPTAPPPVVAERPRREGKEPRLPHVVVRSLASGPHPPQEKPRPLDPRSLALGAGVAVAVFFVLLLLLRLLK